VELAGVSRPEDVGSTIARALAVTPVQGESIREVLCRYLASKRLLLVIDNFEHVLGAAVLVAELIAACPELNVLATSREALDLAAEHRVPVWPPRRPGRFSGCEPRRARGQRREQVVRGRRTPAG
jgi:predicted ATPase